MELIPFVGGAAQTIKVIVQVIQAYRNAKSKLARLPEALEQMKNTLESYDGWVSSMEKQVMSPFKGEDKELQRQFRMTMERFGEYMDEVATELEKKFQPQSNWKLTLSADKTVRWLEESHKELQRRQGLVIQFVDSILLSRISRMAEDGQNAKGDFSNVIPAMKRQLEANRVQLDARFDALDQELKQQRSILTKIQSAQMKDTASLLGEMGDVKRALAELKSSIGGATLREATNSMPSRLILWCDDEYNNNVGSVRFLRENRFSVLACGSTDASIGLMADGWIKYAWALTDMRRREVLPGLSDHYYVDKPWAGLEFLELKKAINNSVPTWVLAEGRSKDTRVQVLAREMGAIGVRSRFSEVQNELIGGSQNAHVSVRRDLDTYKVDKKYVYDLFPPKYGSEFRIDVSTLSAPTYSKPDSSKPIGYTLQARLKHLREAALFEAAQKGYDEATGLLAQNVASETETEWLLMTVKSLNKIIYKAGRSIEPDQDFQDMDVLPQQHYEALKNAVEAVYKRLVKLMDALAPADKAGLMTANKLFRGAVPPLSSNSHAKEYVPLKRELAALEIVIHAAILFGVGPKSLESKSIVDTGRKVHDLLSATTSVQTSNDHKTLPIVLVLGRVGDRHARGINLLLRYSINVMFIDSTHDLVNLLADRTIRVTMIVASMVRNESSMGGALNPYGGLDLLEACHHLNLIHETPVSLIGKYADAEVERVVRVLGAWVYPTFSGVLDALAIYYGDAKAKFVATPDTRLPSLVQGVRNCFRIEEIAIKPVHLHLPNWALAVSRAVDLAKGRAPSKHLRMGSVSNRG